MDKTLGCVAQAVGTFGGGGAERMAFNSALAVHLQWVKSVGIALKTAGPYTQQAPPAVKVIDLQAAQKAGWGPLRAAFRLREAIRREEIDLLHVHGHSTLPFVLTVMGGLRKKPRVWFTWHLPEQVLEAGNLDNRRMLKAMNQCERVLAASEEIAEKLRKHDSIRHKITFFPNGVPTDPNPSTQVLADVPVILWMARFVPSKDPLTLIRVARELKDDGYIFKMKFAGSAPPALQSYFAEAQDLVEKLDVKDRVELLGWREDSGQLLRDSAMLVQTSHTEGLSMTLLEAMMAGLACVATNVGSTGYAIKHNKTGILIKSGDSSALYRAIRQLLQDRDLRSKLAAGARARALEEFSLEKMGQRLVALYKARS